MIDIISLKGEKYSFDPSTSRVFKDNVLLSSSKVEPLYSSLDNGSPEFSGILLKEKGVVLSLSGKESAALMITDENINLD